MDRTRQKELEGSGRWCGRIAPSLGRWMRQKCRTGRNTGLAVLAFFMACTSAPVTRPLAVPEPQSACKVAYEMAATLPPWGYIAVEDAAVYVRESGNCIEYYHSLAAANEKIATEAQAEADKGTFWTGFGAAIAVFFTGFLAGGAL